MYCAMSKVRQYLRGYILTLCCEYKLHLTIFGEKNTSDGS